MLLYLIPRLFPRISLCRGFTCRARACVVARRGRGGGRAIFGEGYALKRRVGRLTVERNHRDYVRAAVVAEHQHVFRVTLRTEGGSGQRKASYRLNGWAADFTRLQVMV